MLAIRNAICHILCVLVLLQYGNGFACFKGSKTCKYNTYILQASTLDQSDNDEASIISYIQGKYTSLKNPLWNSTIVELKRAKDVELKFFSRKSFKSDGYFETVLRKGYKERKNPFEIGLIASLGTSFVFTGGILPILSFDTTVKNTLGLFFLLLPFLYMGASTLFPSLMISLGNKVSSKDTKSIRDRLCYHEAGHFIVGYICGYPILTYSIEGDSGANLVLSNTKIKELPIETAAGGLLAVSMAGIVAESLLYGDAIGGAEDWPFAFQILYTYIQNNPSVITVTESGKVEEKSRLSDEIIDEYIRGAVIKALVLLRLNREKLDRIAMAMSENKSVYECIDIIES